VVAKKATKPTAAVPKTPQTARALTANHAAAVANRT
jgi:hypothetical protein